MKYLLIALLLISSLTYAESVIEQKVEELHDRWISLENEIMIIKQEIKKTTIELAKNNLANLLGIDKSEIQVKSVEKVTWSDTALGYEEKGYGYATVETDGFRIILSYNGKGYEYHTDMTGYVKLDPKAKEQFI